MKKLLSVLLVLFTVMPLCGQTAQLAFPGADGYAKYVTGGRGGKVYHVTRLDDCTDSNLVPGTFRWALRTGDDSPRTIVFDVCGTIYLNSKLKTTHPNVSILGQSAPGGGICLTGYPLYISSNNVIVRYMRFRAGDVPDESLTGLDVENAEGVILDHCSMTWSMEECLTMFDCKRTTVQWCIIGEGLYNSKNSKGARAYATQWGGEQTTMHHTLITNSHSRSPRFNGVRKYDDQATAKTHDYQVDSEFANNVIYNWSSYNSIYGGENNGVFSDEYNRVYMVGNYYRPGPSTKHGTTSKRYWVAASSGENSTGSSIQTGQWYLSGNKFETSSKWAPTTNIWSNAELEKVNADNLYGYDNNDASRAMGYWSLTPSASLKAKSIIDESYYKAAKSEYAAESADAAFANVVSKAGASLPRYDEVDQRLLDEAAGKRDPQFIGSIGNGEYGIIDSPSNITLNNGKDVVTVGGTQYSYTPFLGMTAGQKYAVDSDGDGMPDAYEDAKGLNKLDPADGNAVAANGYTNLENYLNGLADGTLNLSDYQTSAEYVEPGQAVRKNQITVTFDKGDATGVVPAAMQVAYGGSFTTPTSNTSLYKDGYTMQGWTDGNTLYAFGQTYQGVFIDDVVLHPSFKKNIANLAERSDDVTLKWDFTSASAPSLEGNGVYVCQATVNATPIDVALLFSGKTITIPACNGAVADVVYTDGTTQKLAATAETLSFEASATLRTVIITLPYTFDPSGIAFHAPAVASGTNYEMTYFTHETDASLTNVKLAADWMQWMASQQRLATRNCIDPVADNGTYYVSSGEDGYDASVRGTTITGPIVSQQNKVVMYVKDVAKIRTFVSGSCYDNGNSKDRVLLTAYPADGSDKIEAFNTHPLDKATLWSESFDVELDPEQSYMVVYSSMSGFDMMLGAVKLFDKTAASAAEGDGKITWTWETEHDVEAVVDPAKIAESTKADYVGTSSKGASSGTAWLRFPNVSEASENYYIAYTYTPAAGVSFAMKSLSFENSCAAECDFNVTLTVGNGSPVTVKAGEHVSNTAAASPTKFTYPLDIAATREPITVKIYPYNIAANKAFRLKHITFEGHYDSKVVKHSFNTAVSPANAGAVQQTPKGNSLAEGTKVTLAATAAAGYDFVNWTNSAGTEVSKDAEFVYTIGSADEVLTANFNSFIDSPVFTDGPFQAVVSNAEELKTALKGAAAMGASRFRIFLKNGTYDFGTTAMTAVPKNTSLIGESQQGVIIKNNPGIIEGSTNYQDKTPVLFIGEGQDNVYMQDITICAERDWAAKKSQGQCLALRQRSKQAAYKNVTLQGVQDTYYLNKAEGTAYFENCTVAGNVDYVYGDGTMWFEQCVLQHVGTGGYIVAPNTKSGYKGIVMNDCTVDAENSGYYLGRPWDDSPAATFLGTTFNKMPAATGWAGMTSGLVVRFHEYGSKDANGTAVDLSSRSISACNAAAGSDSPVLDATAAATYTVANVLTGWNPQQLTAQVAAARPNLSGTTLTWDAVPGAYAYAVVKNGVVVGFTTSTTYNVDDAAADYKVRAANEMGGLGIASESASTGIADVIIDNDSNAAVYNLAGQRVNATAKGVVIKNGKKTIR